jgi:hypothetical protein
MRHTDDQGARPRDARARLTMPTLDWLQQTALDRFYERGGEDPVPRRPLPWNPRSSAPHRCLERRRCSRDDSSALWSEPQVGSSLEDDAISSECVRFQSRVSGLVRSVPGTEQSYE